jgi:hypothetical protein
MSRTPRKALGLILLAPSSCSILRHCIGWPSGVSFSARIN